MGVDATTRDRFQRNHDRVVRLIALAGSLPANDAAEVLRAAVVLLHASLEDFLRSLAQQFWPEKGASTLDRIPLPGQDTIRKVTAKVLVGYGSQSARELLEKAITNYLETHTFNDITSVGQFLGELGVGNLGTNVGFNDIKMMIRRRHGIVHRADRAEGELAGQSETPIEEQVVRSWTDAVRRLADHVVTTLA